jgi:hypothetical protein
MLMGKLTDYDEKLTLEWLIETLSKEGKGSKQVVLNRLKNMSFKESYDLMNSLHLKQFELFNPKLPEAYASVRVIGNEEVKVYPFEKEERKC